MLVYIALREGGEVFGKLFYTGDFDDYIVVYWHKRVRKIDYGREGDGVA